MYKILQINVVGNWGSTGRIANDIGDMCISNGWKSYIGTGRKIRESKSEIIKIGDNLDLGLHKLKSIVLDRHGFGSTNATLRFIEQIKNIKPDIIHLHNLHGYYINIDVLFHYLCKSKIPVVWTLHDCWAFTGHCTYFDRLACDKWITACYSCPQKTEYPTSLFKDNSKKNYVDKKNIFNSVNNLTLIPVSNWLEGLLKKSFLKTNQIKVINNGIDLNEFSPKFENKILKSKLEILDKFIVLGVASYWTERKGFDDFVKLSKIIDNETVIVLVGLNDIQLKSLPSNIIGIKRTSSIKDLVEIYSLADLYMNLTYEDNFPTTNLEALACGTPVLTYNTGGSIECISDETGFIVQKGDFNQMKNIIEKIKFSEKGSYQKNCRIRAEDFYDKNVKFNEYIDLYKNLLSYV